jgi:hypothetical protein
MWSVVELTALAPVLPYYFVRPVMMMHSPRYLSRNEKMKFVTPYRLVEMQIGLRSFYPKPLGLVTASDLIAASSSLSRSPFRRRCSW